MNRDVTEQSAIAACTYSAPCDVTWRPLRDTGDGAVSGEDSAPCGDVAAVLAALRDGGAKGVTRG